jgi:hypothetical protein
MTFQQFSQSLSNSHPPNKISALLEAMWYDANGQWSKAHEIVQVIETSQGAWLHAYLHRKEGDEGNAGYWYRKAGKPFSTKTLQ